jgi:hypothetical protein
MALIKPFATPQGVTATYHKLLNVEVDSLQEVVQLVVAIYNSQEARDTNMQPLWHEYVRVPFNRLSFDPREIFYPLLQDYDFSYLVNADTSVPPDTQLHPPVFQIVEPPPPPPPVVPPGF